MGASGSPSLGIRSAGLGQSSQPFRPLSQFTMMGASASPGQFSPPTSGLDRSMMSAASSSPAQHPSSVVSTPSPSTLMVAEVSSSLGSYNLGTPPPTAGVADSAEESTPTAASPPGPR